MVLTRIVASVAVVMLLSGGVSAWATQEPPPERTTDRSTISVVTGELLKIDPDATQLSIKAADDTEWTFAYTEKTEIVGEDHLSGLATDTGTLVSVHFIVDGKARVATKIEVDERRR